MVRYRESGLMSAGWAKSPNSRQVHSPSTGARMRATPSVERGREGGSSPVNRQAVNRTVALFALLWAVLAFQPLHADEIHLKNGRVIEGRVVAETKKRLVIEVPYGRMTLDREEISEIVRTSEAEYLKGASERIFRAGDVEGALELLRRRCQLEPENQELIAQLRDQLSRAITLWIESRRLDKAQAGLQEFLHHGGDRAQAAGQREQIEQLQKRRIERDQRARRAWREGAIETAYRLWSELREEYPHRADEWRKPLGASALRLGHDALLGRRLERARQYYLECLELDPDRLPDVREPFALCEVERVRPHLERGEFVEADRTLREALDLLPDEPALLFHRALVVEATGDYREAGKIYAKLAGARNRTIEGQKYLDALRQRAAERVQSGVALAFREESTPEIESEAALSLEETRTRGAFVVHHTRSTDPDPVLDSLERHLRRLEKEWFGGQRALPEDAKVDVYLHPGRTALLAGGDVHINGCDGYVRTERRYGILVGQEIHLNAEAPRLTTGVVPHELAHLLFPHRIGRGIEFPAWIDEGIACNEEPTLLRRHRARTLRDAQLANASFPLTELFEASVVPTEGTAIFYAQSMSVIAFLEERLGWKELLKFAKKTALEGIEPALNEVAGYKTIADLQLAWSRWLEK